MSETRRAEEKLRQAVELWEVGVELMRQNLRRRHPGATQAEITAMLAAWLRERPGAEQGDAEGRAVDWQDWIRSRRS